MEKLIYPKESARLVLREGGLYHIGGTEPYFVAEAVEALKKKARQNGCKVKTLFGDALEDAEIVDLAGGGDLFADKYLIVIKESDKIKADAGKKIAKVLAGAGAEAINAVVFVDGGTGRLPAGIKKLEPLVPVVCYALFADQLKTWIARRCEAAGYSITALAVTTLTRRLGGNLARIDAELAKLFLYMDRDKSIDELIVDRVVYPYAEGADDAAREIARLTLARRAAEALTVLRRTLAIGGSEIQIGWHVGHHFRRLLHARAALDACPDEHFERRLARYRTLAPLDDFKANQEKRTIRDEARAWLDAHPGCAFAAAAGLEFARLDGRSLADAFAQAVDYGAGELLALTTALLDMESGMKSGTSDPAAALETFVALSVARKETA